MARSLSSGNNLSLASAVATAAPITLACWFNPTSATTAGILVSVDDGSNQNALSLRKQATSVITAQAIAAGAASVANTTTNYGAGTWQHACGVFASITDRRAFLAGAGKGTNATSRTPTGLSVTNFGYMGGPVVPLAGDLGEVAAWSVALSDAEVALLAAGRSPTQVQPAALIGYWRIAGTASPEPPTVGASSLTLVGTPPQAGTSPTVDNPLSGSTAGASTAAGTLTGKGAMLSASVGASTDAGALTATGALVGASPGASTVAGALTGQGALAGAPAAASIASGTLVAVGALAGQIDATSAAAGTVTAIAGDISGTIAAVSTASLAVPVIVHGSLPAWRIDAASRLPARGTTSAAQTRPTTRTDLRRRL